MSIPVKDYITGKVKPEKKEKAVADPLDTHHRVRCPVCKTRMKTIRSKRETDTIIEMDCACKNPACGAVYKVQVEAYEQVRPSMLPGAVQQNNLLGMG